MARLKVGAEIKTYEDVTNLIIELINRSSEFKADFIIKLTKNYIQRSSIEITEKDISHKVYNILDLMQSQGYLTFSQDIYIVKSTKYTLDDYQNYNQKCSMIL